MKVKIQIIEGCTNFSYTINNKEFVDLTNSYSQNYDIELLNSVCEILIKQATTQYNLPDWIVDYLWDGEYEPACSQSTFIKLVKQNKNTKETYIGTCEVCGDMIFKWELELII